MKSKRSGTKFKDYKEEKLKDPKYKKAYNEAWNIISKIKDKEIYQDLLEKVFNIIEKERKAEIKYPAWICFTCGNKYGDSDKDHIATFHTGDPDDSQDKCGWCGSKESLTQPRDYGRPEFR